MQIYLLSLIENIELAIEYSNVGFNISYLKYLVEFIVSGNTQYLIILPERILFL